LHRNAPRKVIEFYTPFAARLMVRIGKLAGCDYLRDTMTRAFMG
jgi:hypothetical protein